MPKVTEANQDPDERSIFASELQGRAGEGAKRSSEKMDLNGRKCRRTGGSVNASVVATNAFSVDQVHLGHVLGRVGQCRNCDTVIEPV